MSRYVGFDGPVIDLSQLYTKAQYPGDRSVYQYGARCDGTTDDAAALQAAFTDAATHHLRVFGTCRFTGTLTVPGGAHVTLEDGSWLQCDSDTNGGLIASCIVTQGIVAFPGTSTKANDILIDGHGKIGKPNLSAPYSVAQSSGGNSRGGNIIAAYGDRITFKDFTIDHYGYGTALCGGAPACARAIFLAGDHDLIYGIKITDPQQTANVGGIRYLGGSGFRAIGNVVFSGDDTLQLVPGAPGGVLANLDITDAVYANNIGGSYGARFIAVALNENSHTGTMTDSIRDVAFLGNFGFGSVRTVVIDNQDSSGSIKNVTIAGGDLTVRQHGCCADEGYVGQGADGAGGTYEGPVNNVVFRDVHFYVPSGAASVTSLIKTFSNAAGVNHVVFDDCTFDAPTDGTQPTIRIDGGNDITIGNSRVHSPSAQHAIMVGTAGTSVDQFTLRDTTIDEIRNGTGCPGDPTLCVAGLRLAQSTAAYIANVKFAEHTGETSSLALSLANTATNVTVISPNTHNMTNAAPVSDAASATRFAMPSQNNVVSGTFKFNASFVGRNVPTITGPSGAAHQLTLTGGGNAFHVTPGNSTIDTIVANNGQCITLFIDGNVTIDDLGAAGGNISLQGAANWTIVGASAAHPATLHLCSDATNWIESGARRTP